RLQILHSLFLQRVGFVGEPDDLLSERLEQATPSIELGRILVFRSRLLQDFEWLTIGRDPYGPPVAMDGVLEEAQQVIAKVSFAQPVLEMIHADDRAQAGRKSRGIEGAVPCIGRSGGGRRQRPGAKLNARDHGGPLPGETQVEDPDIRLTLEPGGFSGSW